jgi:hypothetical protein
MRFRASATHRPHPEEPAVAKRRRASRRMGHGHACSGCEVSLHTFAFKADRVNWLYAVRDYGVYS